MSLDVDLVYIPDESFGPASDILEEKGFLIAAQELRRLKDKPKKTVYEANITHNLTTMAEAAGIYQALWRPDEYNYNQAKDIIPLLEAGLVRLKARPKYYERYNAPNGWGLYKNFVPFVEKYLQACKDYPEAYIEVSR